MFLVQVNRHIEYVGSSQSHDLIYYCHVTIPPSQLVGPQTAELKWVRF